MGGRPEQSPTEVNMTETPRETQVLDAVVTLVDSLLDDFDVVDLLTDLTERCAALLDVSAAACRSPSMRSSSGIPASSAAATAPTN